ncbi:hypothetical protein A2W67_01060 [Candidatus Nomurabacteria bacterium RIFCSPLOWO2_02_40_28]|uniref:Isoprenylcysteine carboxyl methyltransferase n=2 Tax=Candidatus Nomuraibacteriota TaxID=1752729 RepID=A0A837HRM1_9BACT|nr:MAG: hypothetical protein UT27_C0001G0040 [Candidatus Nomurabacteria bacterium GW2011_GWD2_39_12]KKR20693.1 MAG: hypothetical protein UT51_C0002G0128 [Candidatus Nomurabacteria bacterium GW2011_GWC2_39_41]KKR37379.1 MAG: hypothetical protein UT70_C0001G0055 [Candidatus Nomurabacteria bacterium GW2011_GWE2_40_10]KKR38626.1 MAG: hypothetical protein UT73_C0002G0111 [Candidatus Nomurabacteria bacterium GW2011_GWB1_40_11]KKR40351.1 MAG: hypothetical protein UT74_C0001G0085 [Parcubacteria group b
METINTKKHSVHKVLAHSYVVYLIFFLLAIYLDAIFGFKVFPDTFMAPVGLFFLILASVLILSAQKTGHEFRKIKEKRVEHFHGGPYHYTRIPTQWGLFFLMLGFGVITNSFFVIVFSIISFLTAKFIFIEKQEKMLEEKYGTHYTEYKKSVKF